MKVGYYCESPADQAAMAVFTQVYGTDRPSLELETKRALEEARRIIQNIKTIETAFPVGFGLMAAETRSWHTK
jgi:hypothetical protein